MNKLSRSMLLFAGSMIVATSHAELYRVGPSDLPSPPGHGYPLWYQDNTGLALDLCVPQSLNQLDPCLATPAPGDPLPTLPYTFPDNWSDEFFWFGAEAALDLGNGNSALLVQAVEAAFALGPPSPGDQIAFSRIRIRIDAPVDGTYTVTFPYGEETFPNIQAGGSAIFHTSDIGIGSPGVFTGALHGAIGPFLTAVVDTLADPLVYKPYHLIDGESFLADPLTPTQVTGSPFGTNLFKICVDNVENRGLNGLINGPKCTSTDQFALIGKVHTAPIASPLDVTRAIYTTHSGMSHAHVDVFATAEAAPGELTPVLSLGMVGANSALMDGPRDPGGQYYAQGIVSVASLPDSVTVINSVDTPPSFVKAVLVDQVSIVESSYDATSMTLTITAISSDMLGTPELSVLGLPESLTGSDMLVPTLGGESTLTVTLAEGVVPPETVTVVSTAGGSVSTVVKMPMHNLPFPAGAPLAVDDVVSTGESEAVVNIAVLTNDGVEAVPASLALMTSPLHGTATPNAIGTVDYVPDVGYFGTDSFQYTVSNIDGLSSNIATVTIDVQQINDAPVANNDDFSAPSGVGSITVDVVSNDTDLDGIAPAPGGLDPTTVVIISESIGVSATSNGDGTVTFTKGGCEIAVPPSCSFTYSVSDNGGLSSEPATVTISVETNLAPTANADSGEVLVEREVIIDVAANDSDSDGSLDLASIMVTTPTSGNATANTDGTVTFTAGPNPETVTFSYSIADNLGDRSNDATVTVTVNPNPDTLGVLRSTCKVDKAEWRVDGTSSILTPHTVTVYAGSTVGGTVIADSLPVDNLGEWRVSKNNTSAACISVISVESSLGGKLENIQVNPN